MKNIKKQFSLFKHQKKLVYLDNASSTQTPDVVVDAMNKYYQTYRSNIHRGLYKISEQASEAYEAARQTVANFLHAGLDEIVFTSGTTHGLNLLAHTLGKTLKKGDNVVLSRMEHHANLIPWQEMAKEYGFKVRFVELQVKSHKSKVISQYELDLDSAYNAIDKNTKIVSVMHVSNTLGTINPIEEIIAAAKKVGAITIIDAAQSVAHLPIDVKKLDCDALVFSGHKIYGPTGIGILYAKKALLETMEPLFFGGDMIREVTYEKSTWADAPAKFEAGTPNIAGAIGLAAAIRFVEKIGWDTIQKHENELTDYALNKLAKISGLTIIGPTKDIPPMRGEQKGGQSRTGVISFTLNNIHPHDIATILDSKNIAVRAGHHCTMPLMKLLGVSGTTRISFGLYNSRKDIDQLIEAINQVKKIFT